jgi:cell wall assembly regulator SMI1
MTHRLTKIRKAYDAWLDPPDHVLSLRRPESDPAVPSEMDVLFFLPVPEDRLPDDQELTTIATAGMSTREMQGPSRLVELVLWVRGRWRIDELEPTGRRLAELAVAPYREGAMFAPNLVLRGISLPLFARMSCALLTDHGIYSPEYLPGLRPPVRLLQLHPLFEEEADIVEQIGDLEANRRFLRERIVHGDPRRAPARHLSQPLRRRARRPARKGPSIERVWQDIETWLAAHAPRVARKLARPASEQAIAELEQKIGVTLPADFQASLARHDGRIALADYELLSVAGIRRAIGTQRRALAQNVFAGREVEGKGHDVIQNLWWHAGWIPFASDSAGNLLCIDMAPAPDGVEGQVIFWERETGPAPSAFPSFRAWLTRYRDDLLKGDVYRVDEDGFIVPA